MGLGWYVARTEPRAEALAADELKRDGLAVFAPRVRAINPKRGHEEVPLFPGYLFVRCDPQTDGWPVFRPLHRILGWVNFGGDVPSLPDELVNELRDRLEVISSQGGMWRYFQPGEKVRVVSQSLEGLAEVVDHAKSPEARVKVLLEFMGRRVPAQVPWQNLLPVEPEPFIRPTIKPTPPRRTRGRGRWIGGFNPVTAS